MLHREPLSACNDSAGFVAHCATASACHTSAIPGPTGLAMDGPCQGKAKGRGSSGFGFGGAEVRSAMSPSCPATAYRVGWTDLNCADTREANMLALLTEHDVSKQLRVSLGSLRRWRMIRQGPPFFKVGPLVRYRAEDVEAWLSAQPTGGAQSQRKAATDHLSA